MNVKSNGKSKQSNFKVFNAVLEETPEGLKVVGAFGAPNINCSDDKWVRLNARYFARALNNERLVIK